MLIKVLTFAPIVAALCLYLSVLGTARAEIKVTHDPVSVEYKTFDPDNPPKDLPPSLHNGHEGATTMTEFDCKLGMDIAPGEKRPQRSGKCQQSMVIETVKLAITLKFVIWLPSNATAKLKAHEEGHRQIAEAVFKDNADKAAHAACALVDGRRITAEADDCDKVDKAMEVEFAAANKKVYEAYLAQTADVSARVGDIYDELTAHGAKMDPDEKTAIARSFAKQALEAKSPATKPVAGAAPKFRTTQPVKP